MIVDVELWAFGEGEVRQVEIPDVLVKDLADKPAMLHTVLGAVFRYGQNDYDPQQLPSVSVGDVINIYGGKYMIKSVGFHSMSKSEYESYIRLPRVKRIFHTMAWKTEN